MLGFFDGRGGGNVAEMKRPWRSKKGFLVSTNTLPGSMVRIESGGAEYP